MGLQVVGIDARDPGLDLARSSGADVVIDARIGKEKVVEEVKKVTGQKGVDSALTISDAPDAAALACAITKVGHSGTALQKKNGADKNTQRCMELWSRSLR